MIAFDLQCENQHQFEGWFDDSAAFDDQVEKGLIACPVCNSTHVTRMLSTFGIKSKSHSPSPREGKPDIQMFLRKVSEFVEKNFEDVGTDFSSEALKMHYGVTEQRSIRGVSTEAEEETLREEGIQYFKMPVLSNKDSDA